MTRSFRTLILTTLAILIASVAQAALSSGSRNILDRSRAFGLDDESESKKAKDDLKKVSPVQILTALREGLTTGGEWLTVAARAAAVLQVHALLPDLKTALEKNDDWKLITTIGQLAKQSERNDLANDFEKRLWHSTGPSKVAIIETFGLWDLPLSDHAFSRALADESFEVRQVAVREFLRTRTRLSVDQQSLRFEKSFELKPYQVRLEAMTEFANLDQTDRFRLKKVIGSKFKTDCKAEAQALVKQQCDRILALKAAAK